MRIGWTGEPFRAIIPDIIVLNLKRQLARSCQSGARGGGLGDQWGQPRLWLRGVDEDGVRWDMGELLVNGEGIWRTRLQAILDCEIVVDYD